MDIIDQYSVRNQAFVCTQPSKRVQSWNYDSYAPQSGKGPLKMGPKDHGAEQRAPVEFMRRMQATLEAGTVDLPAFPQVVIQVQEVLKNPNYSLQMIVRPISADPTLANRLLNMANSTAFNATGRVIIDLGVALTRLGAQKVYSVVLAHAIQDVRRLELLRPITKPMDELWSESVAVAHFCGAVVKRLKLAMPDAFAAGLLHRVGHLYILVQLARTAGVCNRVSLCEVGIFLWTQLASHDRQSMCLRIGMSTMRFAEAVGMQARCPYEGAGGTSDIDRPF